MWKYNRSGNEEAINCSFKQWCSVGGFTTAQWVKFTCIRMSHTAQWIETTMAARLMIVNEVLCYISCVRNTSTIRHIQEAVINLFNQQAVQEAFHLYHTLRRKGLISRAKASDKIIKCIMEWMTEEEVI